MSIPLVVLVLLPEIVVFILAEAVEAAEVLLVVKSVSAKGDVFIPTVDPLS